MKTPAPYANELSAKGLKVIFHRLHLTFCLSLIFFTSALVVRSQCTGVCDGDNTAVGSGALESLTDGRFNVAVGSGALTRLTDAYSNTAVGWAVLECNNGFGNTALGFDAMTYNTTGTYNTALGRGTLGFNTVGTFNVAVGDSAMNGDLTFNITGSNNVAIGSAALLSINTGNTNTAVGDGALFSMTSGNNNVALGQSAGHNLATGSDNIEIGSEGAKNDSGVIRIGTAGTQTKTFIAGISGVTVGSGAAVMINSKGQLGVVTSSARYKDAIKPMAKSSEAILSLKPVTFHYKKDIDPDAIPQFGLVAEDVAKVDPDLVAKDDQGKPYTVRYEAVNAMLLNEFLKEHRRAEAQAKKVEAQATKIEQLETQLQQMAARLDAKGL